MFGGYKRYFDVIKAEQAQPKVYSERPASLEAAKKIIKIRVKDEETGLTKAEDVKLAVVRPTVSSMPPRSAVKILEYYMSPSLLQGFLDSLSGVLAVDIETNGTQAADTDVKIVGIGVASKYHIYYFDFLTNSVECNEAVLTFLSNYDQGLVAHNVMFDGTFLLRDTFKWWDWRYDTYAMYRQLANEGYPGHKYGLKEAQIQLLGWQTKGDVELDKWLVLNGHVKDVKKDRKFGYLKTADGKWARPNKGEMHRAPASILGYYCGLDAASTWMLLHEVFLPSIENEAWCDAYLEYHRTFIKNVELLANQQLTGITIDKDMLEKYKIELGRRIVEAEYNFLNHEKVRPFANMINDEAIEESEAKEPEKFKKQKWPKEPAKFKKNGQVSKVWEKWCERVNEMESTGPEVSKVWVNWYARHMDISAREHFNINSSAQLIRLLYDYLEYPIILRTYMGGTPRPPEKDYYGQPNAQIELWENTPPATGSKALPQFGEIGELLKQYKLLEKEMGYVKACLEHLRQDSEGHWRLHPQFRAPGTLTCRLAGSGGLNLQQIPKSRGYLECWRPLPGKAWVDCDHTSLEQVVMAELSKDKSLFKIYGPDAKPNDIYLFNGSQLPGIGEKLRAHGYDPDMPDPEAIAKTKKLEKPARHIAKVITLGSSYGMGAKKLQATLDMQGVKITEEEAKAMHSSYWELYGGVKEYESYLKDEHKERDGYVLNGIGRPVCCAADYMKDIVNRVVQSTGHDLHMLYIQILDRLFREHNLMVDGIVWDFHDQSIVECDEKDVELVKYLMGTKAYEVLNEEYLSGVIPLTGDPQIIRSMADAKCE